MASVTLTEYECRKQLLPNVCMQCGEEATTDVKRKFSWYPQWIVVLALVALLPAVIVAAILTKKMTVHVPMCERHKGHWFKRTAWLLGTLAVLAVIGIGGIAFMSSQPPGQQNNLTGVVCGGGVFGLLAWLILVVILQSTMIKPTEITEETITLTKVHPQFIEALEEDREQDEAQSRKSSKDSTKKSSRPKNDRINDDLDDE